MNECFWNSPVVIQVSLRKVVRLVSPAMESLNTVSYLVLLNTKGMSKVALFMRMKFVNFASSDTRSSDIISA